MSCGPSATRRPTTAAAHSLNASSAARHAVTVARGSSRNTRRSTSIVRAAQATLTAAWMTGSRWPGAGSSTLSAPPASAAPSACAAPPAWMCSAAADDAELTLRRRRFDAAVGPGAAAMLAGAATCTEAGAAAAAATARERLLPTVPRPGLASSANCNGCRSSAFAPAATGSTCRTRGMVADMPDKPTGSRTATVSLLAAAGTPLASYTQGDKNRRGAAAAGEPPPAAAAAAAGCTPEAAA
jgi:hypothetical protein